MEQWTLSEPHADRFRMHINFGGPGFWCMFDYVARPVPTVTGIEVVIGNNADTETAEWFPHLKRGIESGWQTLQEEYGRLLTRVLVEVTNIHTHPVATTAKGCEYYGWSFALELGRYRAVQLNPLPQFE